MKRFSSSPETLGSLFYPPQEKKNRKSNFVYDTEFQAMLDGIQDDDCTEESNQSSERKRRLSFDQVKALEKIFEVDNKLDPLRKTKIAQELGLQPRQVAIWFQNRRARSKTKQLEKDYDILKASYEAFKLDYEKLETEKEDLAAELKEARLKLREVTTDPNSSSGKQRTLLLETEINVSEQSKDFPSEILHQKQEITSPNNGKLLEMKTQLGFRDGLSDNSNCTASPPASSSLQYYECSSMYPPPPWMHCYDQFQFLGGRPFHHQVKVGPQQVLRMDEQCWFGATDHQEATTTT